MPIPRPVHSHSTGCDGDKSDDSTIEFTGEQPNGHPISRMAVIYEPQSWKKKSSMRGMRSKAAAGPASNTLFDGKNLG